MISGEGKYFTLIRCASDEEWRAERKNGVGASDVSSIMGLNKWKSPLEVWLEKTGRVEPEDIGDKPVVRFGNDFESVAGERFKEANPEATVRRVNAICQSIERPYMRASLDYEVRMPGRGWGVLEIKTSAYKDYFEDSMLTGYKAQVTQQLIVTGREYGIIWAFFRDTCEYAAYEVERDEGDVRAVEEAVDGFWKGFVETDAMPQALGCPTESKALTDYYGAPSEEFTPMLDEDVPGLDELAAIKAEMDALKRRKDAIENNLREIIGMTRGIETEARRVTWVRSVRTSYDYDALDAEHPGLRDQYRKTSITNGGIRVAERK